MPLVNNDISYRKWEEEHGVSLSRKIEGSKFNFNVIPVEVIELLGLRRQALAVISWLYILPNSAMIWHLCLSKESERPKGYMRSYAKKSQREKRMKKSSQEYWRKSSRNSIYWNYRQPTQPVLSRRQRQKRRLLRL